MPNFLSYASFNSFALRSPLFPIDGIRKLTSSGTVIEDDLKLFCSNPFVKEALYLASPEFYGEFTKWMAGEMTGEKNADRMMQGVYKYISRMCTRCTPFGLFAGITTGTFSNTTNLDIDADMSSHRKCLRLDMNYVCALAHDLSCNAGIKHHLLYFTNNSAYKIGDKIRYVEYSLVRAHRQHKISEVDAFDYLDKLLERASEGARIDELANAITDSEVTLNEAIALIDEVIDSQLLVSELESTVSGDDPLDAIITTLGKYDVDEEVLLIKNKLQRVRAEIASINSTPIGQSAVTYDNLRKMLSDFFKTQYDNKFLFQADMRLNVADCSLDEKKVLEIRDTILFLNKLCEKGQNSNLEQFKSRFYEVYEDEKVPLSLVMDTDAGIGYIQGKDTVITPLIDDIVTPVVRGSGYTISMSPLDIYMKKRFQEALKCGAETIEIKDEDFIGDNNLNDLPETILAMIRLFPDGKYSLSSAGGSCAANLLGRFCHMCDGVNTMAKDIIAKDELDDECIYAEIVHLPESRVGNILHRPHLRSFEMPYLASSSLPKEKQIPLEDLMLSVENNKLLLTSKQYGRRVIPRLTTAHNFSFDSLPVYQFLCDMQTYDSKPAVYFSWGHMETMEEFLPRVIYKNAILSPCTWNILPARMQEINKEKDHKGRISVFRKIAAEIHIADEVVLADSDNELYINIKNDFSVHTLLELVKNRSSFQLKEFLYGTDSVRANELVLAFYKQKEDSGK